jgi:membrane fusion protein, copper/silver efflux system
MTDHDTPQVHAEQGTSHPEPGTLPEQAEFEKPPRGVRGMAVFRWVLIAGMAVIAALSVAYSLGLVSTESAGASATQYYCPMHPQVVQDHPGECPICSMTLVAKEVSRSKSANSTAARAKDESVSHDGHRHNPSDPYYCPMHPEETGVDASARCPICGMKLEKRPPGAKVGSAPGPSAALAAPASPAMAGTSPKQSELPSIPGLVPVELSFDRVQMIGVRTARATTEALGPELRTVGFVTADEAKVARVHTRFSGWVEHLAVARTGQKVRRGQVLAGLYNLELLPAQQEFLAARRWSSSGSRSTPFPALAGSGASLEQDARTRLELFGMSRAEIDRIAATGKPARTVAVSAPISGYVTRKGVVQGTYIQPGTELFEIADLSKVWVLGDIYEYEIGRVSVGQAAAVTVAAHPNQRFPGKVGFIYPTINPEARTLRVRLELDNKDLKLRPGMYGDVVIQLDAAPGVVIPAEALVDTGEHQYVFLAKEGGRYEPRPVKVGARSGNKVQILEGIAAGDIVVTTANFLIDSESRLRAAIEGTPDTPAAPGAPAAASACDKDFDKAKFPDKYQKCRECERVHRGMGTMEEDCKNAIAKPWR